MTVLLFSLILLAGSFLAGLVGSLTGLGGGVIIIPMLTLLFGVDIHYAIGASLVSVIATSSGAAAAYVKEGISNIRIGMFLEIATTLGAVVGAMIAIYSPTNIIAVIFGFVLIFSAAISMKKKNEVILQNGGGRFSKLLKMNSSYPTPEGDIKYNVQHVPTGFFMMAIAGIISGLLGIGSGALKVIAMDHFMKLPFKVSTTTSNFMIGVTAAASAGIYLDRGYIAPGLAMPVMLGVLAGSLLGARHLVTAKVHVLRWIFAGVVGVMAVEMIVTGVKGKL